MVGVLNVDTIDVPGVKLSGSFGALNSGSSSISVDHDGNPATGLIEINNIT